MTWVQLCTSPDMDSRSTVKLRHFPTKHILEHLSVQISIIVTV